MSFTRRERKRRRESVCIVRESVCVEERPQIKIKRLSGEGLNLQLEQQIASLKLLL